MPKYNLYKINPHQKTRLIQTLEDKGLENIHSEVIDGFQMDFFFSSQPDEVDIWWTEVYGNFFLKREDIPTNQIYFATLILSQGRVCYAVSLGKAHFYLKRFCDTDFGLNLAERIIDSNSLKVKNSKFFKSKKNKTITSYGKGTEMDYGSGESMHYLKTGTIDSNKWGKTVSFGNSVQFKLKMTPEELPQLINQIELELQNPPRIKLPKTELVKDEILIDRLDKNLVQRLLVTDENSDIQVDDFSVSGVDFIFSDRDTYSFYLKGIYKEEIKPMELTIPNLMQFVKENGISLKESINDLKVKVHNEHGRAHSQSIKSFLDYIDTKERYCLIDGKWHHFNKAYLDFLHKEINKIGFDYDENFDIAKGTIEDTFNKEMTTKGYINCDKDLTTFEKRFKVEYADLYKENSLYFVKFGSAQKLGYVIDQAINTVNILQNDAGKVFLEEEEKEIKEICLWLGLERKTKIDALSDINSLIFQMKLANWRRLVIDAGFRPKVKVNYKEPKEKKSKKAA